MEVLKFTLEGKFGFFKKPDVNASIYFTYGNIHRVALLGVFGALLGYRGYNQMSFNKKYGKDFEGLTEDCGRDYPEFYERLKHLKLAIAPKEASISKKVQTFNNSVGYASHEAGGNLIVREQWLENPSWTIYLSIDNEEAKELSKAIVERNFAYIPYLGKNDHLADIKDIQIVPDAEEVDSFGKIDSLFIKEHFQVSLDDTFNTISDIDEAPIFKYEEKLPIALDRDTNKYEFESFIYTNSNLMKVVENSVYRVKDKNIVFI